MNNVTISSIGIRSDQRTHGLDHEGILKERMTRLSDDIEQILPDKPDLIVLPEFCDSPYMYGLSVSEEMEYYRQRGNQALDLLSGIAKRNGCYIAYPAFYEASGIKMNSTRIIDRAGNVIGQYSKNHLTFGEIEEYGLFCGKEAPLIECDFGKVACAICFDLNFDELMRRYAGLGPDLILFSSMFHGGLMQNFWAYSCRSYFVGAVWDDVSAIISPLGEAIASSTNYHNYATARINLDCAMAHLDFNLDRLKALKVKYGVGVTIREPGHIGSVLVTNETEGRTVYDLFREFEIEGLDEYFARARILQNEQKRA